MLADNTIQSMGGKARAESLSVEQRKEIATKAAEARWGLPKATHEGEIKIGDLMAIPCAVLDDGTRLITQRGMYMALGRYKNPNKQGAIAGRPGFLGSANLTEFISNDLERSWEPIKFRLSKGSGGISGNIAIGYRAEILPMVCHVYEDAQIAGVLRSNQLHIAEMSRIVSRSFSKIGIIALVDEATGFQFVRDKQALQKILEIYLMKEFAAWAKRFPDDFYKELFRLRGWSWDKMSVARPGYVGKLTNDLVYERLAPGILDELKRKNPKTETGNRKAKHHQWLTEDVGHPALAQHLHATIALMRASSDWKSFYSMIERALPKKIGQLPLLLDA